MEQSLGEDIRRTNSFFRQREEGGGQKAQADSTGGSFDRAARSPQRQTRATTDEAPLPGTRDLSGLTAVQDQLHDQGYQQQNLFKVVRNQEREVASLDAKVDDLWRRLPKVVALLEPLQVQVDVHHQQIKAGGHIAPTSEAPPTSGSSREEVQALAGAVRAVLQDQFKELRGELERALAQVSADVEGKASTQQVESLSSRLVAWTQHAPGCAMSQGWKLGSKRLDKVGRAATSPSHTAVGGTGYVALPTGSPPDGVAEEGMGANKQHTLLQTGGCHERCKAPTCPRSLGTSHSSSRLPELRKY